MSVTVTERQFFERRIEGLICSKIAEVHAKHPAYREKIRTRARAEARKKLNQDKQLSELHKLQQASYKAHNAARDKATAIYCKINGCSKSEAKEHYNVRGKCEDYYDKGLRWIEEHTKENAKSFEQKLMAQDNIGKQILKLEKEKEKVTEAVYLATSNAKLVELYHQIAKQYGVDTDENAMLKTARQIGK